MAVFLPESSNDSAPPGLDLMSVPPNQVAIESRVFEDVRPVSQFNGHQSPILFEANIQGNVYTDLSKCTLFLKARILKSNGSTLDAEDKVSPVNLWFHALFRQVDFYLNGTLVSSSGDLYPYNAYFKTLLRGGFTKDSECLLTSQLMYRDSPGSFDENDPAKGNYGLYQRHKHVQSSKLTDMYGFLLNDALELDRYLLNGVTLRLVLTRSKPEFSLMGNENDGGYQIVIEDAFLRLVKQKINVGIIVAHSNLLKSAPARYPFTKSMIKCANIPANQNVFVWDNIVTSYIPKFVAVAFCDSDAVLGSYSKSPWNFKNYSLSRITLAVNGISVPASPITADYKNDCVMEVHERILDYCKTHSLSNTLGIDRRDISYGFGIYLFNIQPPFSLEPHFNLLKSGVVRLEAQFGAMLPETTSCLMFLEWDTAMIEIDEGRNVKLK